MHDHDLDVDAEGAGPEAGHRHDDHAGISDREIGRGVEAGRPDALGLGGLLHLQRTAGNSGVAALVAQRRATHDDDAASAEADAGAEARSPVHDVVQSGGTALEPYVRADMEAATGQDYGDVRVHSDGAAASSARSVQAHAYTVGNHIVFGEGRYQPETAEGRHTLAHELTHVVQQRQGPVDGTDAPGGIKLSDPGDRFEREAESVASRVASGTGEAAPTPVGGAGAAPVQRREDEDAPVQRQKMATEEEEAEAEATEAPAPETAPDAARPAPETAPGVEAAAPAPEAPAEAPPEQAEEEEEGATVSKLDQGIDVQRQDEDEEESVTKE